MSSEDETRQSAASNVAPSNVTPGNVTPRNVAPRKPPRAWRRWFGTGTRQDPAPPPPGLGTLERIDASALEALPALLDCSTLPNGVVELVIEDFEAPTRQLFDIHDGHIALVEPGQCVPWASISGSATAWARALGPDRDMSALKLTGDAPLARGVLAAMPRPA